MFIKTFKNDAFYLFFQQKAGVPQAEWEHENDPPGHPFDDPQKEPEGIKNI